MSSIKNWLIPNFASCAVRIICRTRVWLSKCTRKLVDYQYLCWLCCLSVCVVYLRRCDCWTGWGGGDCSERTCAIGVAWSDEATSTDTAHGLAVCSNRGECNHETGRCSCMSGFSGAACERSNCPRGCSGHGHCRSMSDYAKDNRGDESIQYLYNDVRLRDIAHNTYLV